MNKKFYLTVDTETATIPFANQICKNANQKQKIAIAKPLVYDIGWSITDRQGNIVKTENFLVQETFFVPNIFNTAYYRNKRPIYMELLEKGEIKVDCWNNIMKLFIADLEKVDISTAYNACFDFKKAIPFTERYIKALYSSDYQKWEDRQKKSCEDILNNRSNAKNEEYLNPYFELRGVQYPIADLWCIACERLININKYRNFCLDRGYVTNSVVFFKSSAETSFQYLMKNYDFIEDHTALSDALIESQILTKALKKGKIEPTLYAFPFRDLGSTIDYAIDTNHKYVEPLYELLLNYIENNNGFEKGGAYWKKIMKELEKLENVNF